MESTGEKSRMMERAHDLSDLRIPSSLFMIGTENLIFISWGLFAVTLLIWWMAISREGSSRLPWVGGAILLLFVSRPLKSQDGNDAFEGERIRAQITADSISSLSQRVREPRPYDERWRCEQALGRIMKDSQEFSFEAAKALLSIAQDTSQEGRIRSSAVYFMDGSQMERWDSQQVAEIADGLVALSHEEGGTIRENIILIFLNGNMKKCAPYVASRLKEMLSEAQPGSRLQWQINEALTQLGDNASTSKDHRFPAQSPGQQVSEPAHSPKFFPPESGWREYFPLERTTIGPSNEIVGFPSSSWIYDPANRSWSIGDASGFPAPRLPSWNYMDDPYARGPSVALYGDKEIFVSGGPGGERGTLSHSRRKDAYIANLSDFKTQEGMFIEPLISARRLVEPMTTARQGHVTIQLSNGGVLACGGFTGTKLSVPLPVANNGMSDTCEVWMPGKGWKKTASMPHPGGCNAFVQRLARLSDGRVLTSGAWGRSSLDVFDPTAEKWTSSDKATSITFSLVVGMVNMSDGRLLLIEGSHDFGIYNTYFTLYLIDLDTMSAGRLTHLGFPKINFENIKMEVVVEPSTGVIFFQSDAANSRHKAYVFPVPQRRRR